MESYLFMRRFTLWFLTVMLSGSVCLAQEEATKKEQVIQALNETATYISEVLINEEGYSRCDYNIPEGKWYDYEPPWHTGQAIYALIEAYRITGNSSYIQTATRAGGHRSSHKHKCRSDRRKNCKYMLSLWE